MPARRAPLHPFLFAAYPVLFLFARNLEEARAADVLSPLALSIGAAALILLLARLLFRSPGRAPVIASIVIGGIFAYGHAVAPLRGLEVAGYVVGRGLFLMPVWSLLMCATIAAVARSRKDLTNVNAALNVAGGALVVMTLVQLGAHALQPRNSGPGIWSAYARRAAEEMRLDPPGAESLPDIYLIILDEYARDDVLQNIFGYDNSGFLRFLEERGFYVARGSHSNYTITYTSLASSLNMDYLPRLAETSGAGPLTRPLLSQMIEDNLLVHTLKSAGYRFYMLPSEFYVTNRNRNADHVFRRMAGGLNEFERVLVGTTMLRPLMGGVKNHRLNRLYKFHTLPEVARLPGPKLVFAHIIMPHLPYVFDRDGNIPRNHALEKSAYTLEEYRELYVGQVHYLNGRMREVIDRILTESRRPPVIVVQGDHGFRHGILRGGHRPEQLSPEEQSAILNAIYLPGGPQDDLYPSISSVNTFRLILSRCLGADLPLLPDETYVTGYRKGIYTPRLAARWPRDAGVRASGMQASD